MPKWIKISCVHFGGSFLLECTTIGGANGDSNYVR
eukprot:COSAG01_NODE_31167_length_602_cov_3.502982_1_plen_34_part_10